MFFFVLVVVVVVAVKQEAVAVHFTRFEAEHLETTFKRNQQLVGGKGDTIRTKTRNWTC